MPDTHGAHMLSKRLLGRGPTAAYSGVLETVTVSRVRARALGETLNRPLVGTPPLHVLSPTLALRGWGWETRVVKTTRVHGNIFRGRGVINSQPPPLLILSVEDTKARMDETHTDQQTHTSKQEFASHELSRSFQQNIRLPRKTRNKHHQV